MELCPEMQIRKLAKCREGAEFRGRSLLFKKEKKEKKGRKRERKNSIERIEEREYRGGGIQDGVGEVKGRAPGISTH